ncbi:MAG: HEPN domain-containing protein [Candidatus Rokubacteria bacterium]|nr:HEPN domain-containing protein [Candidatus Rokubacteria bacterium]
MRPNPRAEAERRLAQARSDLVSARVLAREGLYAQACFHCPQAAEMALKAVHYLRGARFVVGHSVVDLLAGLIEVYPSLEHLRRAAASLDRLYIPTRYPNGLPGGVPAEVFAEEDAADATQQATLFVEQAATIIG